VAGADMTSRKRAIDLKGCQTLECPTCKGVLHILMRPLDPRVSLCGAPGCAGVPLAVCIGCKVAACMSRGCRSLDPAGVPSA
jgi:hypothetical protein